MLNDGLVPDNVGVLVEPFDAVLMTVDDPASEGVDATGLKPASINFRLSTVPLELVGVLRAFPCVLDANIPELTAFLGTSCFERDDSATTAPSDTVSAARVALLLMADAWEPPRTSMTPTFTGRPGSRRVELLTPCAEVLGVARAEAGCRCLVSSFVPLASLCGAAPELVDVDDNPFAAEFALIGDWDRTGIGISY